MSRIRAIDILVGQALTMLSLVYLSSLELRRVLLPAGIVILLGGAFSPDAEYRRLWLLVGAIGLCFVVYFSEKNNVNPWRAYIVTALCLFLPIGILADKIELWLRSSAVLESKVGKIQGEVVSFQPAIHEEDVEEPASVELRFRAGSQVLQQWFLLPSHLSPTGELVGKKLQVVEFKNRDPRFDLRLNYPARSADVLWHTVLDGIIGHIALLIFYAVIVIENSKEFKQLSRENLVNPPENIG